MTAWAREVIDQGKLDASPISAVDLFCGAGGLTHGLIRAGIRVAAGIDVDPAAAHAYSANNAGAQFLEWDVCLKDSPSIAKLFADGKCRLLAGCAPCQPFSKLTNGIERHRSWDLLDNFGRFVEDIEPELVSMENVPELAQRGRPVFENFVRTLEHKGYSCDWKIVNCADYGAPQSRKRLVLLASQLGPIAVPKGRYAGPDKWRTVRQTIGDLPPIATGEQHPHDPLHAAALLSPLNLQRIRATPHDGGTKADWPNNLVLDCHRRQSGARYHSIYGRMWWDKPAPTMTTLCNGIGNGRFGHPEQDRAITLREAALLQTFPRNYEFWERGRKLSTKAIARMIGNAVPPELARSLGDALMEHVRDVGSTPKDAVIK
jgi:DNA (cytosine-5)-methyltransferase 1